MRKRLENIRRFLLCAALIGPLGLHAQSESRPTRASRLDRSLLRDNGLFAQNKAPEPVAPVVPAMRAPTPADVAKIKAIDRRYRAASSVSMDLGKTLKIAALGRERSAKGRVLVAKGRMRLEIDSPDRSLLVIDRKNAWLVNYPSDEFKGAALQVVKSKVASSKKARSQAIVGILAQGGFLKHFKVVGIASGPASGDVYYLQPDHQLVEFTRAQARLTSDGTNLQELRYWDELGNETALLFSNVRLNGPAPDASFRFVPPADADVTTL